MRGTGSEGCQLMDRTSLCGCSVTGGSPCAGKNGPGVKMFQAHQTGAGRPDNPRFLGEGKEYKSLAGGNLWVDSMRGDCWSQPVPRTLSLCGQLPVVPSDWPQKLLWGLPGIAQASLGMALVAIAFGSRGSAGLLEAMAWQG